jgi:hypothetical protein
LLARAAVIRRGDEKLIMFLVDVIEPLIAENKKLLIFTEYRATQAYLQEALAEHFPEAGEITLINGSLTLDEKLAAIDALYAEILGEVLDNVDLASVLQSATAMEIERTGEQIEEAIARAKQARELEQDIFAYAVSFEPDALRGTLGFTMQHVDLFIRSMLPVVAASLNAARHNSRMLEIRLPEQLRGRFPEFAQRTVVNITTDRRLAQRFKDVVLLDFEADFFRYLIDYAKSHEFEGFYAAAESPPGIVGALGALMLRWQNDQGDALTEEFVPVFAALDGRVECNPSFLAQWLISPLVSSPTPSIDRDSRSRTFEKLEDAANRRLAAESTRFKHPNSLVYLAAADCICREPISRDI